MSVSVQAAARYGRRVVPALCLGSFVVGLMFSAPAPFLARMADDLDTSVPVVGQVTSAIMILSAGLGLFLGPLADRYGYRRLIVLGIATAVVTQLLFAVAPFYQVLFLAALCGSFAQASVPGLSLAVASSHFSGPAARRAVGWTVAALASAAIIGVPALTAIGGVTTWRTAFLAGAIATFLAMVLVAQWLPPDRIQGGSPPRMRIRDVLSSYQPLLRDREMLRLYACCVLRATCWFGLLTYVGAFLQDRMGLSVPQTGLVYMLGGSSYFAGSLIASGPLGRVPPMPLLAIGNSILAVTTGLLLSASLGTAVTVVLLPVAAFAGAVGWIGLVGLLSERTPVGSGTTMVLNSSLMNLGAFGGASVGGVLIALGGYTALAEGLPVFGLLSGLVLWSRRDTR